MAPGLRARVGRWEGRYGLGVKVSLSQALWPQPLDGLCTHSWGLPAPCGVGSREPSTSDGVPTLSLCLLARS